MEATHLGYELSNPNECVHLEPYDYEVCMCAVCVQYVYEYEIAVTGGYKQNSKEGEERGEKEEEH